MALSMAILHFVSGVPKSIYESQSYVDSHCPRRKRCLDYIGVAHPRRTKVQLLDEPLALGDFNAS